MKNKYLIITTLLFLFICKDLLAKELARINLKLTGEVVTYSCAVEFENNKIVNLKSWGIRNFKSINSRTEKIPFIIRLVNCPPDAKLNIFFVGEHDPLDNELLSIDKSSSDSAKGIAIEILDMNKNRLPLGKPAPSVIIDSTGNAAIPFFANYISVKESPTAGIANSKATFMFSYD
ncbi:fimbrial protein [Proteus mirabilis]|uniref:fimbrial protein n=1 Tax=Proteus mirabilis TaxID=584 RepID=UPI0039B545DA